MRVIKKFCEAFNIPIRSPSSLNLMVYAAPGSGDRTGLTRPRDRAGLNVLRVDLLAEIIGH
jgi:hypothetical protein